MRAAQYRSTASIENMVLIRLKKERAAQYFLTEVSIFFRARRA